MSDFNLTPTGVVIHPHKVLRDKAEAIGDVAQEHRDLARSMIETMTLSRGIGLAAPQIGKSIRMLVMLHRSSVNENPKHLVMIDPEIISSGSEETDLVEGCLSIPSRRFVVKRPSVVRIGFTFLDNKRYKMEFTGISAKCAQHEIDHLNGILICDRGPEFVPEPEIDQPSPR
ncbi:peptide deformylase [Mesorhizobium sp. SP-1A]|uniref:peptide deformylase n=1 Tax=Mesorhizobium sp. SP-1A TaxID=3077840 RepID=UPI0028F71268|nr:peptide deformylase [Mesorhizobium sp. SP-1A]